MLLLPSANTSSKPGSAAEEPDDTAECRSRRRAVDDFPGRTLFWPGPVQPVLLAPAPKRADPAG